MIKYRILEDKEIILIRGFVSTPLHEVHEFDKILRKDPNYSPDYDVLADCSHIEKILPPEELKALAKMFESITQDFKLAIVAPKDSTYGMSRMYEMLTEAQRQFEVGVFRGLDEALAWLGRDSIDIEGIFEEGT